MIKLTELLDEAESFIDIFFKCSLPNLIRVSVLTIVTGFCTYPKTGKGENIYTASCGRESSRKMLDEESGVLVTPSSKSYFRPEPTKC
jgi:hypothetical protein